MMLAGQPVYGAPFGGYSAPMAAPMYAPAYDTAPMYSAAPVYAEAPTYSAAPVMSYPVEYRAPVPPPMAYPQQPVQVQQMNSNQRAGKNLLPLKEGALNKYNTKADAYDAKAMRLAHSRLPVAPGRFTLYDQQTNRPVTTAPLMFDHRQVIKKEAKQGRTRNWPSTPQTRERTLAGGRRGRRSNSNSSNGRRRRNSNRRRDDDY
eukprot:NODE_1557_length_941_cov_334.085202_g1085_i0.p1 GENE.NODE_1557_length_941_cov_334.085202_g1085_i0~~NODE_1557_length_941_cov_334.085202_g1085_i0.p1  ORF type:complete len:223 (+),score=106.96 NODE_1557_length_941_cov_334.085202_g1085_i0:60-671(+)